MIFYEYLIEIHENLLAAIRTYQVSDHFPALSEKSHQAEDTLMGPIIPFGLTFTQAFL